MRRRMRLLNGSAAAHGGVARSSESYKTATVPTFRSENGYEDGHSTMRETTIRCRPLPGAAVLLLLVGFQAPLLAQRPSWENMILVEPAPVTVPGSCALGVTPTKSDFCIGCYDVNTGDWLNCQTQFRSYFQEPDSPFYESILYWLGGHFHTDTARPIGKMTCNGMDAHDPSFTAFSGYTRSTELTATKTIPEVSGVITVSASYTFPPNYYCVAEPWSMFVCDAVNPRIAAGYFGFYVATFGFIELPPSPDLYIRCGNSEIPGENVDPDHPSPFWGTPDMVAAVDQLARDFQESYPDLRLRILDLSLPLGGVFDGATGNYDWHPPHCRHRTGTSVDVSRSALSADNSRAPINIEKLTRMAVNLGMRRAKERPEIHYELN